MFSPAYASREILERIFSSSTALDDLFEEKRRSSYNSGDFLERVQALEKMISANQKDRLAITQVCKIWRVVGLKFCCKHLIIDAKLPESWDHVSRTLQKFSLGQYVRRLHFDAFDSNITRVKSAIRILRQCPNIKQLSMSFADDSRKGSAIGDLLIFAIQSSCASTLEHIDCNFGNSFDQGSFMNAMSRFPNLQTLELHSALGKETAAVVPERQTLDVACLRKMKLTTTHDGSLGSMCSWGLPCFEELSIFLLHSATGSNRRFFANHGSKLRSLELTYFVKGVSELLCHCINLEELILSLDGLAHADRRDYPLFHAKVMHVGIRDMCTNAITARTAMTVLNKLMGKLTCTRMFPNVREIRLLDFHRALLTNLAWLSCHVDMWNEWFKRCEDMLIVLQAADGKQLGISLTTIINKNDPTNAWLSMRLEY